MDAFSSSVRTTGLRALQECLGSEQRRARRGREAIFVLQEEAALGEDSKGGDEVRSSRVGLSAYAVLQILKSMSTSFWTYRVSIFFM